MRKLNKLLAGVSVAVLTSFNTQAACVPADCSAMGYTKSASDCEGSDMIKCPFDTNQVWCVEKPVDPKPGMILYSDGTVSWNVVSGKTAVGIVAYVYVASSTRFAVALAETRVKWGPYGYDVSCLTNMDSSQAQSDFNGVANTQCLINDSQSHPAAEYCNTYKPVSSGTGRSGWYLPAAGELKALSKSYAAINARLQKLGSPPLSSNYYWSSSEYDEGSAWHVNPSDGNMDSYYAKLNSYPVRCVLAF